MGHERFDTVVIGGGQAGLTTGYYLKKAGRDFVILDASERVGDAWRNRWDSLRLFTPARFDGLPGMKFPASGSTFPTKDEMADFLATYAKAFDLPVRNGIRVERLSRPGDRYVIRAGDDVYEADNVVVAMGRYQAPKTPPFASELAPEIRQLHSSEYRNLGQLQDGPALVVGLGNSGADIGLEVAKDRPTFIAGKEFAVIPFRIETFVARNLLLRIVRFVGHRVLTIRTPIGRKAKPILLTKAAPLIRVKPKDLVAAGAERVGRIVGVKGGLPITDDGQVLDIDNIIWCTGYRPGLPWLDLPVIGEHGIPEQRAGISQDHPGLYFVGMEFEYSQTSETITGMPRDARRVVKHLTRTRPAGSRSVRTGAGERAPVGQA